MMRAMPLFVFTQPTPQCRNSHPLRIATTVSMQLKALLNINQSQKKDPPIMSMCNEQNALLTNLEHVVEREEGGEGGRVSVGC